MLFVITEFQNVDTDTDHSQASELILLLTSLREFRCTVEHQFARHFIILYLQVFHIPDNLSALVLIKQYRIPAVLFDVHS